MVVTDAGRQVPAAAESVEAVVLAAEASVRGVRSVLRAATEFRAGSSPLVVFTEVVPDSGVSATEAVTFAEKAGLRALPLRHDAHLATGSTLDISRLAPPVALDVARIAAAVVEEAVTR